MKISVDEQKLVQFDALSHYQKYTDIFDYEDVPEAERKEVAKSVSDWVIDSLSNPSAGCSSSCAISNDKSSGCCG